MLITLQHPLIKFLKLHYIGTDIKYTIITLVYNYPTCIILNIVIHYFLLHNCVIMSPIININFMTVNKLHTSYKFVHFHNYVFQEYCDKMSQHESESS